MPFWTMWIVREVKSNDVSVARSVFMTCHMFQVFDKGF